MAHNINYNEHTKQHAFFSVAQKPWHGLGQIVSEYPTSREAITYAGLDYRVEKRKLFTYDNQNIFGNADTIAPGLEVPNYYATVRQDTDTVLGVVGREYEVVQNVDAFAFFDAIVGGDGIQYETAGALGKGERIFITAKLPDYIKVGNDDLIEKYLFLTTSHDGFGSIRAAFTPVRIVCQNTLSAALRKCTNSITIRHTTRAKERLEQAHKLMGIADSLSIQLAELFNRWATVQITDKQVKNLIRLAMAPNREVLKDLQAGLMDEQSTQFKNVCDDVFQYTLTNPTQQLETTKGTLFGAYNGITGYYQNVQEYKSDEAKLRSLLLGGNGQQKTQKAFDLCLDFMKLGNSALFLN
jgi:phage/plasmid-like protein (TIGR03299 family)